MSINRCGLERDEEVLLNSVDIDVETKWNGRIITRETGGLAYLVKNCNPNGVIKTGHKISPLKGSAGGSIEGTADSKGNSSIEAEVHVSSKDKDGNTFTISAEGNIKNTPEGDITSEASIVGSFNIDF